MSETALEAQKEEKEETAEKTTPESASPTLKEAWAAPTLGEKFSLLLEWWNHTRIARTLSRYSMQNGYLLAGGIAYTALFSLFAGLALGVTIAMKILAGNQQMQNALFSAIDQAMPGVLILPGKDGGLVKPEDLILNSGMSIAGIIAVIVLVFAAMRVMAALRTSIRAMFGIAVLPLNAVREYLRDLATFVALMLAVLATAILGLITSTLGGALMDLVGLNSGTGRFFLRLTALVLAACVDALMIWVLVRFSAGVRVPRRDLLIGLAMGAVGSGVLRFLGTSAVKAVDNPILASFAALITVLLWVNLLSRVVLQMSAFMANPPISVLPENAEHIHANETPNYVTMSAPHTLEWPHQKITGAVDVDPEHDPKRGLRRSDPKPVWHGFMGWWYRRRIAKTRRKLESLLDSYYGRPPSAKI